MSNFTLLEARTRVCPFGVRFWDAAEQSYVSDGLSVYLRLSGSRVRYATKVNTAGIFFAQGLPGLRAAEQGAGDAAYWASVSTMGFVVEVADSLGQFMPFSFPAQLPARGLFLWSCALSSPPASAGLGDGVPLFSSPSRSVSPMRAVIRAQLQDASTGNPASGAVLSASVGGAPPVLGIADAQGRVAIVMPYPEPSDFPVLGDGSSPPYTPTGAPLTSYTWSVTLGAQYAASTTYPAYPDLCSTLSQPTATLWGDTSGASLPAQTLALGTDLVVRSVDATNGTPLPVLLVAG